MTSAGPMRREAVAGLLVALLSGVTYRVLAGGVPSVAAGAVAAIGALVAAGAWYARRDARLLWTAVLLGAVPIVLPVSGLPTALDRGLVVLAVAGLLVAAETGHLMHRIGTVASGDDGAARAMHTRLRRVQAATVAVVAVVAYGPLLLTPAARPWLARSVEWHGTIGVLIVGVAAALAIAVGARARRSNP